MNTEPIPRPLIVLRLEFSEMATSLNSRMITQPERSDLEFDVIDLICEHINKLKNHVNDFCKHVSEGLGTITYETDDHFRRIGSQLGNELNGILNGYDKVRCLTPHPDDFEGWKLLIQIYEDTIRQIQDWLTDVMMFLNDPVAEVEKRKVPTDGNDLVTLHLEMNPPNQMQGLTRWLERLRDELSATYDEELTPEQNQHRLNSADLVIGTTLGLMIGWD